MGRRAARSALASVVGAGILFTCAVATWALGSAGANTPTRSGTRSVAWTRGAVGAPCGHRVAHPVYDHVIWVVMENAPFGAVIGSPNAPFATSLARACGLATHYEAVTHPSLPNYLALTAGTTFGIADDGNPSAHRLQSASLFSEVGGHGLSWRSYEESMGRPCELVSAGLYAVKHNPAAYYLPLRGQCARDDVPMGPLVGGALDRALRSGSFPNFAFITPNVCDDGHSCPISTGDAWLQRFFALVLASHTYALGHLVVFVTWDEGSGFDQTVPLVVVAPSLRRGSRATASFDHYSLLRTTEELLHLPLLASAARARSMTGAFGL